MSLIKHRAPAVFRELHAELPISPSLSKLQPLAFFVTGPMHAGGCHLNTAIFNVAPIVPVCTYWPAGSRMEACPVGPVSALYLLQEGFLLLSAVQYEETHVAKAAKWAAGRLSDRTEVVVETIQKPRNLFKLTGAPLAVGQFDPDSDPASPYIRVRSRGCSIEYHPPRPSKS